MPPQPSSASPPTSTSAYPPLDNHPAGRERDDDADPSATFHKGQTFPTLHAFKEHVRNRAFAQHWEPSVANSNKSKVQIKCRSDNNCPFKVWCRLDSKTGLAVISNVDNTHKCLGAPLADRNQGSRIRFLEQEIPKLLDLRSGRVSGQMVVDVIKATHGFEISIRQAQRALRSLKLGDLERSYTSLDGGDELTMDQEMSMDTPGEDDELSEQQITVPRHLQQQYPTPSPLQPSPMAPQILHQSSPHQHQHQQFEPRSRPSLHAQQISNLHAQQPPMEMPQPQRREWSLQTPSGRTIRGSPQELMMYLEGALEVSQG